MSNDTPARKYARHVAIQYLAKLGLLEEWLDYTNRLTWGPEEPVDHEWDEQLEDEDVLQTVNGIHLLEQAFEFHNTDDHEKWKHVVASFVEVQHNIDNFFHRESSHF